LENHLGGYRKDLLKCATNIECNSDDHKELLSIAESLAIYLERIEKVIEELKK
jgi:hypothetical protein